MREINPTEPHTDIPTGLTENVRQLVRSSWAPGTLLQHRAQFKIFAAWCESHGCLAVPASTRTVERFLSDMADRYRFSSLMNLKKTIAFAHRAAGEPFDARAFHVVLGGIRRTHGAACRQVAPITVGELRTIIMALPNTATGARDRAVLTLGFAGALRNSELIGLDIGVPRPQSRGFVAIDTEGARITLLRSKTDQKGKAICKLIPRGGDPCPVAALEHWLAMGNITSGPIFRPVFKGGAHRRRRMNNYGVTIIVKKAVFTSARQAGMSEAHARARANQVASHSLRAGFVTSAVLANVPSEDIAQHVGWANTQMVFYYMRNVDPMENNPARLVLHS